MSAGRSDDPPTKIARRPRLQWKLVAFLRWSLLFSLALALVTQQWRAIEREREWKTRLSQARANGYGAESMGGLLTDQGIDILKNSPDAELLRATTRDVETADGLTRVSETSPTGVMVGPDVAPRIACVLLDHRIYRTGGADDFPDPGFGLRYRQGDRTLDVLISSDGPPSPSLHQDVWFEIRDASGKIIHHAGPKCLQDRTLHDLVRKLHPP